jgi:protease IV
MDTNLPPVNPASGQPPLLPSSPHPIRPAKTGWGWKVAVAILIILLGISVLLNVGGLLGSLLGGGGAGYARKGGPRLEETTLEYHDSQNKIAVIPVEGIIMSQSLGGGLNLVSYIKDQLDRASDDSRVKAVILKVNSPGGEVMASDDISRALAEFQEDSGKPVIVSMGSLAASGGYYVSAPCRWIVASDLTITGSIGVIMQSYNYRELMDKIGLHPMVFKSGKFKDMLSGQKRESEITGEERAMVQRLVDQTYQKFKNVVEKGRHKSHQKNQNNPGDKGRLLIDNWADYADGRVLSGQEAFDYGFVDELGSFETSVQRALKLAGLQSANLVQYQPVFDLSNLFRLFTESEAKTVKVDLGWEPPRLQAGCLYFLSPTFVH